MLKSLSSVLTAARRGRYAVGAFNTNNLETTQAIVDAAETLHAPVILSISESALAYGGEELVALSRHRASRAAVPVVLHLDHGHSLESVRQALRFGFTSVMIDGSALPLSENITLTKKVVALARSKKISVEGEVGTIGGQEDGIGGGIAYPTVETVRHFFTSTRVSALAVGLGTSHGLPVPHEHIELTLLEDIAAAVPIPLVLHGASNLSPLTIRAGIRRGICKINIDTELRQSFTAALRDSLRDADLIDLRSYLGSARAAVEAVVRQKCLLFGSVNKAR